MASSRSWSLWWGRGVVQGDVIGGADLSQSPFSRPRRSRRRTRRNGRGIPAGCERWAFCEGINRFVFTGMRCTISSVVEPGLHVGRRGVALRNRQKGEFGGSSRGSHVPDRLSSRQEGSLLPMLLPQAETCLLWLSSAAYAGSAPHPPAYNFDGRRMLSRIRKISRLVLPSGMSYRVLALRCGDDDAQLVRSANQSSQRDSSGRGTVQWPSLSNYPQWIRPIQAHWACGAANVQAHTHRKPMGGHLAASRRRVKRRSPGRGSAQPSGPGSRKVIRGGCTCSAPDLRGATLEARA